ncbi:MAG: helix-turn-helix domain-containing protein [Lachnospiraceae bacterium]|nr:helix-turn-helix domain-containing protein [Lachnospiraceae bacterium]
MKTNSSQRLIELMAYFNIKQSDIAAKTGIPKSAISMYVSGKRVPRQNRLSDIADAYNVNEAWLMGYDVPMNKNMKSFDDSLNNKDKRDILEIMNSTKDALLSQDGLMFDGDPASQEAIDSILSAMEIGMEMAKKKNKEKYTPKKYKKD